ncbi:MAG: ATP-binding protein [Armatimonadota bacterium]
MRCVLLLLLLTVLLPVLLAHAWITYRNYHARYAEEFQANSEMGRTVAMAFENYLHDIRRVEYTMGTALGGEHPFSRAEADHLLQIAADGSPAVKYFSWIDPRGRVIASSEPRAVGLDLSDRDHVRTIQQGKAWYVSDLLKGRATGDVIFTVAQGIRRKDGQLLGIVNAAINPERLGEALHIQRAGEGAVAIHDRKRSLVFRSPAVKTTWEQRQMPRQAILIDQAVAGREATAIAPSPIDRQLRIGAGIPVHSVGWAVVATRPVAEVIGPLRANMFYDLALFAFVAVGAFLVALITTRNVTRPIQHLQQQALAFGQGHFTARAAMSGPVELIDLAAAFNQMAAAIQTHVNEREHLLTELEQRHAFLESATDLLPLPVAFFSPLLEIIRANAATNAFFQAHGITNPWQELQLCDPVTRHVMPTTAQPLLRAASGEVITTAEYLLSLPDGSSFPILLHAAPIYLNEELVAIVAAFQDLTEIKAADRAKDDVLAMLSHEFLTPITLIRSWTEIAQQHEEPEVIQQALDTIFRNTFRQQRLVDALLDISRLRHDKLDLRQESADLWEIVQLAAEEYFLTISEQQLTMCLQPPKEPLPVIVDSGRIQQVIGNLLNNAVKFTPPGGSITIAAFTEAENAVLKVGDTGKGIPAEQLIRIFAPFHQLARDGSFGGLGLGLALVRGIVELHGGTVEATSLGEGHGSTFTIKLPLTEKS